MTRKATPQLADRRAPPSITGFDPLDLVLPNEGLSKTALRDTATKAAVMNILTSYAGHYDALSEAIQNALDAIELRYRKNSLGYTPHIWVELCLDQPQQLIRIVDNGVGMEREEFLGCFAPNISYKRGQSLRGNKGVGATYLAYGFNNVRLFSKTSAGTLGAEC